MGFIGEALERKLTEEYNLNEDQRLIISHLIVKGWEATNYRMYAQLGGNPKRWQIALVNLKSIGLVKQNGDYLFLNEGVSK